ncbi:hypothetical protein C8Q79DRAFT_517301 [Trametes meyenii]|nr:hypothetical protein C8Q79DRAFT_517301 [Trametes meyenii]
MRRDFLVPQRLCIQAPWNEASAPNLQHDSRLVRRAHLGASADPPNPAGDWYTALPASDSLWPSDATFRRTGAALPHSRAACLAWGRGVESPDRQTMIRRPRPTLAHGTVFAFWRVRSLKVTCPLA